MDPRPRKRLDSRSLALRALQGFDARGTFLALSIDALAAAHAVSPADRALAVELANGIMRRRLTLDALLAAYSSRGLDQIETDVRTILHVGLYQLVFLDRVPPHAAVDETVKLCHRFGQRKAAGFVNGILRTAARELSAERWPLGGLADCTRHTVPAPGGPGHRAWAIPIPRPAFADPRSDSTSFLCQALSLPRWLVERWLRVDSAEDLFWRGLWFTGPGHTSLRANLINTTRERCLDVLQAAGVPAVPGRLDESIRAESLPPAENIPGFAEGWLSVQDESAMSAVDLLDPGRGESILDMCAAPGGKTTFIAERMRNEGSVLACDIDPRRIERVEESAARLGLKIITCQVAGSPENPFPAGPFDAVLVDVPCSNTGVLGKRPEARWRIQAGSLDELVPLQFRLLKEAVHRTRPGGRIVYSTCSIEPEENERLVESLVAELPNCRITQQRHHRPGEPCDGAYQARLERTS